MSTQLKKIVFKHNSIYKEKYIWPEKRLLSPSRVLNRTSDKSFLEAWRKKVGEKEADRIVQYSIAVGKSMHKYLENKINNKKGKLLPLSDPNVAMATKLAKMIIQSGLKNKLQEVWGVESHLHFGNHYRGIADLIGVYEDEPCIIDFKQKRKTQMERYDSIQNYFTQMAAYGMAHNRMCKTNIKKGVVLIATHDYKFQKFTIQGDAWRKHCLNFIKRLKTCMKEDQ
tara:strand:+ start:1665 stop:2342 length:678 start_codon:yes stop_codon:yes gene_type:complete